MKKIVLAITTASLLSGCGSVERLGRIGKAPKMTAPEEMAMPGGERSLGTPGLRSGAQVAAVAGTPAAPGVVPVQAPAASASLFRAGAGAFFSDQRAARMGDILTIKINIADKAEVGNNTSRVRTGSESASIASLLGLEKLLPKALNPANLASTDSKSQSGGGGNISRSETINMTMSAIVTNVFPNGNLGIRGRQEVRVNNELRELVVSGVVRPQDIGRDNSVRHSQIAEARISYGGRGQLSDAQQARWGQQIYDALFPF
ncbi:MULTISPECIES: flagellar basal body L-ring protein FlgH [unclassified Sphingomonas]|uniref:flagellar basal body L-ring protein FlgH n=1 Tax=unclassified Sphingomonas TaxID=196159 RepID=UPI002150878E|nr:MULTISPECIES: flagellar basal body L-ring protein FlgH [unclassified Sphingomonas]MCR5869289.1 flagellar basal body L-ring protein FlgH [Sphingomonas sp. J344]UUX98978.1 flagellar basal body L-ring protein FlgH [Sphingomonas sp. J315]